MRRTTRSIVTTATLLTLGAAAACGPAPAADPEAITERAPAERATLEVRAEAAGLVEPIHVIEVKSKASGEILALHVETGDQVEHGDVLVEIDPRDVRNALAQAEADLEVARARLSTAEAQHRRARELREANVVTEQELESAAFDAANARAQLVKAETNLELARERMKDVRIRAPLGGTIIEKGVEVGQIIASASANVSGGTVLLRMANLTVMHVRTMVDETDVGRISPGQVAEVTVEAYPGRTLRGEVLKIEPQAVVEQNVTMFPVLVRLDNREHLLRPGMNAEVSIRIARRDDVVTIPNSAVATLQRAPEAAAALGVDGDALRQALRPPASRGRDAAGDDGGADGAQSDDAPSMEDCRELIGRMRSGGAEELSADDRARLQQCRERFRRARGQRGPGGGTAAERSAGEWPGIVFVAGPDGAEPRRVTLGLNDWDRTEVIDGLEPGDEVYLISVALLRQQQERFLNRVRDRAGGGFRGS